MNLWNAKLQRIDRPGSPSATGRRTWIEGGSIGAGGDGIRCVLDGVSRAVAVTLGAELANVDAVLYVVSATLPVGQTLAPADRVLVQPWDRSVDRAFGAATLYEIRRVTPLAGDALTHYQCALRAATNDQ